jgi:TolB-like protein/DNA-binding winged helix-turn-helix (wHTH) protein
LDGSFRVGSWVVEPSLNTISSNGRTIRVEPKVMEVLVCLTQHAGEAVPKEKLLREVWPDTFVTEDALARCIMELRRVFEDDAREPRVIQTIAKRGYRLVAPVARINEVQVAPAELPAKVNYGELANRGRRWRIAFLVGGLAALLILLAFVNRSAVRERLRGSQGVSPIHSLAVLPLQNLSADPTQEYFSEGMTDALITDLAQIDSVKVISRTSSMQYKQTNKPLKEIAQELSVDGIIEGTVQRSGNRVRITAQLIYAPSDRHLWANSYERDMRDVFALEREVTEDIARQVRAKLTTPGHGSDAQPRPVNAEALEAYLQGNYYLTRYGRGSGDNAQTSAAEYFQKAIDADPNFALAYVGLFNSHFGLMWPTRTDGGIARKAAQRAVELAPESSEARVVSGDMKLYHDFDFSGAEAEFQRAIALSPSNANAHDRFCNFLFDMGREQEGMKECEIAQQLDPTQNHLTDALSSAGEYDRAIALAQMLLRSDPDNGWLHVILYHNYAYKGMYKEAGSEAEKMMILFGYPQAAARIHGALASQDSKAGIRQMAAETEGLMRRKQIYMPYFAASNYAYLGDNDRAFYWLEDGYKHHEVDWVGIGGPVDIKLDPSFITLRSDPRFKDLLRRVGLPP